MSYLQHIAACNRYAAENFRPFVADGMQIGEVKHAFAESLAAWPQVFRVKPEAVALAPALTGFRERSEAMERLTGELVEAGLVDYRHGEAYPVTAGDRLNALFVMDRAMVPYFGVRAFGQHMNGYLLRDGALHLWVSRRSMSKRHYPGKLDNLVAGGLPWGLSLEENLAKECWEEAGIAPELARRAEPVGHIGYRRETPRGLKPDIMYCYDLELPPDFTPRCTDGEVEAFELMPLERVAQLVRDTDAFKLNCNLVIIDFLLRRGFITPAEDEYAALRAGLRR